MIIVKLYGGFGNQMFQYATAKALSLRMKTELYLDLSEFNNPKTITKRKYELSVFQSINDKILTSNDMPSYFLYPTNKFNKYRNHILKIISNYYGPYKYIKEKFFRFRKDLLSTSIKKNIVIDGYWQTEKYFLEYENEIRSVFCFDFLNKHNLEDDILNTNSVGVHFRRGDYVSDIKTNNFHGLCDINYYIKSTGYFEKKNINYTYFIFSDDIDWVIQNLPEPIKQKSIFVNTENHFYDMKLMSLCKHNIIANSSFSWWGAWLNKNQNKIVIAPKIWFNDRKQDTCNIIPMKWLRI